MITIKSGGDLLKENTEALVNTVNCVGVMGKGIALQFKNTFPKNFTEYKEACNKGEVKIGKMFVTCIHNLFSTKYIINFPTKIHWRNDSKIEYIEEGLDDLVSVINKYDIKSIAIPPLGCGLGNLNWKEVKNLIINKLRNIKNLDIIIYEPIKKENKNEF